MRQILSIRFLAAFGALAALALLVQALFGGRDSIAEVVDSQPRRRQIELVDLVFAVEAVDFAIGTDGRTRGILDLHLTGDRVVHVVEGTYGEITCEELDQLGKCAVVADLLGEAVVWFALVPMGGNDTVSLPAIVSLEGDLATLENGWQLPYAPILDRRCPTGTFDSFREFKDELGTDFTSIYSLEDKELIRVVCEAQ
jgi:hypothetical protein